MVREEKSHAPIGQLNGRPRPPGSGGRRHWSGPRGWPARLRAGRRDTPRDDTEASPRDIYIYITVFLPPCFMALVSLFYWRRRIYINKPRCNMRAIHSRRQIAFRGRTRNKPSFPPPLPLQHPPGAREGDFLQRLGWVGGRREASPAHCLLFYPPFPPANTHSPGGCCVPPLPSHYPPRGEGPYPSLLPTPPPSSPPTPTPGGEGGVHPPHPPADR